MSDATPNFPDEFRRHCTSLQPGPVADVATVERLLAAAWDDLSGDDGGMSGEKLLGRMEAVSWEPPRLVFGIERHGATVMGSTRAEVQEWIVDLERHTKKVQTVGRRQVVPMQKRFDVKAVAKELADAILAGRADERLMWDGKEWVRLLIGKALPEGSAGKETLAGRRKRLREAVAALLATVGWHMTKANVYERTEGIGFIKAEAKR